MAQAKVIRLIYRFLLGRRTLLSLVCGKGDRAMLIMVPWVFGSSPPEQYHVIIYRWNVINARIVYVRDK